MRSSQQQAAQRWAVASAGTALIAFIGATGLFLSEAMLHPGANLVRFLLAALIGPVAFAVAVVLVLCASGRLSAPAVRRSAAGAAAACGLAALSVASWSVGFEEADAGHGLSWFGSSTLLFFFLAWVAGTVALTAPLAAVWGAGPGTPVRRGQSTVRAAVAALLLGGLLLLAQLIGALASALLLVLVLRSGSATQPAAAPRPLVAAPSSSGLALAESRRQAPAVAAAALFSAVAGLGCALFALTGSNWTSRITGAADAMNAGLAAGALAAIPATLAAGAVLAARLGGVLRWSAGLLCAGLVLEAAAQSAGAGHPAQWPLTLAAATLAGFALALPGARVVPGGPGRRIGVAAVLGLGSVVLGLALMATAAFIAPLAAVVLLVWSCRHRSGQAGQPGPRLA